MEGLRFWLSGSGLRFEGRDGLGVRGSCLAKPALVGAVGVFSAKPKNPKLQARTPIPCTAQRRALLALPNVDDRGSKNGIEEVIQATAEPGDLTRSQPLMRLSMFKGPYNEDPRIPLFGTYVQMPQRNSKPRGPTTC